MRDIPTFTRESDTPAQGIYAWSQSNEACIRRLIARNVSDPGADTLSALTSGAITIARELDRQAADIAALSRPYRPE